MCDYYVDELMKMNIYVKALQDLLTHASWVKAIILVNKWQLYLLIIRAGVRNGLVTLVLMNLQGSFAKW